MLERFNTAAGGNVNSADLQMFQGDVSNLTYDYEKAGALTDARHNLLDERADSIREALTSATQAQGADRTQFLQEAAKRLQQLDQDMASSSIP
jgi:hypothetical protein